MARRPMDHAAPLLAHESPPVERYLTPLLLAKVGDHGVYEAIVQVPECSGAVAVGPGPCRIHGDDDARARRDEKRLAVNTRAIEMAFVIALAPPEGAVIGLEIFRRWIRPVRVGDRTFKLASGTTSEPGRYVKSLGEPCDGSGWTMIRVSFQPDQICERRTQKVRSTEVIRGLGPFKAKVASC